MSFTNAPILQQSNQPMQIVLQLDGSRFTIAGTLNHYDIVRILRPVNFYFQKFSPAELNYNTNDRQLLAIVRTLK